MEKARDATGEEDGRERTSAESDPDEARLSDWLVGHLRVTRSEALAQVEGAVAPTEPQSTATSEAAEEPAPGAPLGQGEAEAAEPPGAHVAEVEPEEPPGSPEPMTAPNNPEPQVLDDGGDDLAEAYAALAFLRPEERARRRRRLVTVAVAVAALLGLAFVLSKRAPSPPAPSAEVVGAPAAAAAEPAVEVPPVPPVEEPEAVPAEEEAVPEPSKANRRASIAAPGSAPEATDDSSPALPAARGGRAVARFPDLPHSQLIELEKAASTGKASGGGK